MMIAQSQSQLIATSNARSGFHSFHQLPRSVEHVPHPRLDWSSPEASLAGLSRCSGVAARARWAEAEAERFGGGPPRPRGALRLRVCTGRSLSLLL